MSAQEAHSKSVPDEILVIAFTAISAGIVAAGVGLAMLADYWNTEAAADIRPPPSGAVVIDHH